LQIAGDIQLNDMPYAAGARFDPDKGCLPGTREKVIAEICDWVNQDNDDTPRVFFLNDVAGAGKSAIAHEVARRFDRIKRLGSSYCFDRAHQAERSPHNVFSTIARDLTDLDPKRKASLLKVVGEQRALRSTRAPREQFEKFILGPSQDLTTVGPTVIVIDALDESGTADSRKGLLSVLADNAANLPSNLRVLVTGRAGKIFTRLSWGESTCSLSASRI
jgi:AAA ATPase domain